MKKFKLLIALAAFLSMPVSATEEESKQSEPTTIEILIDIIITFGNTMQSPP